MFTLAERRLRVPYGTVVGHVIGWSVGKPRVHDPSSHAVTCAAQQRQHHRDRQQADSRAARRAHEIATRGTRDA